MFFRQINTLYIHNYIVVSLRYLFVNLTKIVSNPRNSLLIIDGRQQNVEYLISVRRYMRTPKFKSVHLCVTLYMNHLKKNLGSLDFVVGYINKVFKNSGVILFL
jgi:hypothetical protein